MKARAHNCACSHTRAMLFTSTLTCAIIDLNRLDEAEESLSSGLAVLERCGEAGLEVLSGRNNLAHLFNVRARHDEARDLARRTVNECDDILGGADFGREQDGSSAYSDKVAQRVSERASERDECKKVLCAALNNLANALRSLGGTVDARPIYERSCVLRENLFGPDHPSTLLAQVN